MAGICVATAASFIFFDIPCYVGLRMENRHNNSKLWSLTINKGREMSLNPITTEIPFLKVHTYSLLSLLVQLRMK